MAKRGLIAQLQWTAGPRIAADAAPAAPATPAEALARAIESFGLPQVPAPHNKSPLAEAQFLLKVASEIEHGLLVQYLYAAYSINSAAPAPAMVATWPRRYRSIAIQEMFHLISVQNMLLAVGEEPYFDRADLPVRPEDAKFYPFPFALEPLALDSLAKYVVAESPPTPPVGLEAELKAIADQAAIAAGVTIGHVGVLYAKLYWLFQPTDAPHGPINLDPAQFPAGWHLKPEDIAPSAALQNRVATNDEFQGDGMPADPTQGEGRIVWEVTSADMALNAIAQIAIQGEGWDTTNAVQTHFEEFLQIYRDLKGLVDSGGAVPVFRVPQNANTSEPGSDPRLDDGRIENPGTRLWASLLNLRYRVLLAEIALALTQSRPSAAGLADRESLIDDSIDREMEGPMGVRGLSRKLIQLPRRTLVDGDMAGPPFELPPEALPQSGTELRDFLRKLLDESEQVIDQLLALTDAATQPTANEKTQLEALKTRDDALRMALAAA